MDDLIREFVTYDPATGLFWHNKRDRSRFTTDGHWKGWNNRNAGKNCFQTRNVEGYNIGSILGKNLYAHRVAWFLAYGKWPDGEIDHINGLRHDNRLSNLRDVKRIENGKNQGIKANNTSGVVGVMWDKKEKTWRSKINSAGETIYLGSFKNFDEAVAARKAAEIIHGFHANHGRAKAFPHRRAKHKLTT